MDLASLLPGDTGMADVHTDQSEWWTYGADGQVTLKLSKLIGVLTDIADDLAALKAATVATGDAGGTYTANEQDLVNEIKTAVNTVAAVTLKTVKV